MNQSKCYKCAFSVQYDTLLFKTRISFLILRPFNEKKMDFQSLCCWMTKRTKSIFSQRAESGHNQKKGGNFSACKLCNLISWSGAWSTMELLNTVDSKSKRKNMITYLLCGFSFSFMSMMGTFHWGLSS